MGDKITLADDFFVEIHFDKNYISKSKRRKVHRFEQVVNKNTTSCGTNNFFSKRTIKIKDNKIYLTSKNIENSRQNMEAEL